MSSAALVRDSILASMMMLVIAVGLRSTAGDVRYLISRPGLFVRSVLAMGILFPVVTLMIVLFFDLRPAVKIALFALSLSPVPPFLPDKMLKIERNAGYVYALFVGASVISIGSIPGAMELVSSHLGIQQHIGPMKVFGIVASTVLVPVAVGAGMRALWPAVAPGLSRWLNVIGGVLLLIGVVPVLISQWAGVRELIGDGTLLAIVVYTAVGLLIGHWLGGPDPEDRGVLALATASRHPAVALAIGAASFPNQPDVAAAVLLALSFGIIASIPYTRWRKRVHASMAAKGHP